MKTALIIHGHFYQPPRENPFTGIVPDQESAGKYKNWNEAVYQTCYRPNAYSRYLNSEGKIKKIFNNYSGISFNFGPSLLHWLENSHSFFLTKLKDADRESIDKWGHSNIMAQAFSHTILPLDSELVRKLDIKWAIEDYIYRFGHKPEGFWCPECAVNPDTIDDLVSEGIKFIVLSPWQASKINGKELNGKPAPCDRPFIVKGKHKSISVFFYDPDYASGISFGHLLRNADELYVKLKEEKKRRNNPSLIHWATDGEIYGHHEAFGDMALAALIEKINAEDEFELTNYGSYLEKNPASEEAELWLGEDGKGSSWSCCHGVGRWERDCGCHTGGDDDWNQKWRGPLRKAFNNLEKSALRLFETEANKDLLYGYGQVLSGRISLEHYLKSNNVKDIQKTASILDITKNIVYMYTSCGWFFNDISGIEPVQNMQYAYYVATCLDKIYGSNTREKLIKDLAAAKSNINSLVNGKTILLENTYKLPAPVLAASIFVLNRHFACTEDNINTFGIYRLISIDGQRIIIKKSTTLREFEFCFNFSTDSENRFEIKLQYKPDKLYTVSAENVSDSTLRNISEWIEKKLEKCISEESFREILTTVNEYVHITTYNSSALNESVFVGNLGLCVKALHSQIMNEPSLSENDRLSQIRQIAKLVKTFGSTVLQSLFIEQINNQLNYCAAKISHSGLTDNYSNMILEIIKTVREEGFIPDITLLQDVLNKYITGESESQVSCSTLNRLADDLNFSEAFKN